MDPPTFLFATAPTHAKNSNINYVAPNGNKQNSNGKSIKSILRKVEKETSKTIGCNNIPENEKDRSNVLPNASQLKETAINKLNISTEQQ